MSVKIEPFVLSDLLYLNLQERHLWLLPLVWRNVLTMENELVGPFSWTLWHSSGVPLGSGGILDGTAWAFMSPGAGRYMLAMTRGVMQNLHAHVGSIGPVYADIDSDHLEAIRWAKLLGFRPDTSQRWVFGA